MCRKGPVVACRRCRSLGADRTIAHEVIQMKGILRELFTRWRVSTPRLSSFVIVIAAALSFSAALSSESMTLPGGLPSVGLPMDSQVDSSLEGAAEIDQELASAITEDTPIDGAGEMIGDGESAGGLIFLDDVPVVSTPEVSYPRVHMQGEHRQDQAIEQPSDSSMPFTSEPDDEPSPPPSVEESAAPGSLVRQWTALSNSGWFPPDTIHSVGPAHVVEAVNSGFAVYNKQGDTIQGYTTFDSFMHKPTPWAGFMYDPRVIYDKAHERFLMLILGLD